MDLAQLDPQTVPTAAISLAVVVGLIAPYLVAIVNQPQWAPSTRRLVTAAVSIVLGAATAFFQGAVITDKPVSGATVLASAAAVLVASQAMYKGLFGRSAAALERATSPADTGTATD